MRLWFAIVCAAVGLSAQSPPEGYVRAVKLHQAGELEQAAEAYRDYLTTDPGRPEALTNLGAVLAALGRFDEALAAYDDALTGAPGHPGIRRNRALALYKSGRITEAAEELDELRQDAPNDADLAILAADCRAQLGRDDQVIKILEPLAGAEPDNLALAYLLGSALIRQDRVEEGRPLVDKILGAGESAEAHVVLGLTYVEARELDKAQAEFERAVELNRNLPGARSALGKTLLERNERDAAAQAFRAELEVNPLDYDSHFFLGVRLREDGSYEPSLKHLETARRLRPAAMEAAYQAALCRIALQQYEAARETLEEIVLTTPDFAEAHVSLAQVYFRLGRKADAERHRDLARNAGR